MGRKQENVLIHLGETERKVRLLYLWQISHPLTIQAVQKLWDFNTLKSNIVTALKPSMSGNVWCVSQMLLKTENNKTIGANDSFNAFISLTKRREAFIQH